MLYGVARIHYTIKYINISKQKQRQTTRGVD